MEEESINLKNSNTYKIIETTASKDIKNIIFGLLIIFLVISLSFNFYFYFNIRKEKTSNLRGSGKDKRITAVSQEKFIKYNTYNIFIDNIEDFLNSENLILIPGEKCPNPENKITYFFKPKYPPFSYEYIKFQQKNFSLKAINDSLNNLTLFTEEKSEMREIFLKKLGFNLDKEMKVHNLYSTPYSIDMKLKKQINKNIINKYQKINRFYNYKEYVSKSLLYYNYQEFKKKFPNDYNYMLKTYSFPEEKDLIIKKFGNYSLNNNKDIWMIKPSYGSLGLKITILTNFSEINLKNYLITKYLHNPHLIKGYKYDLRFHGLVSTIKPIKLYLYNEGLVRIASEKYHFNMKQKQDKYSYLTNLYINKKNKNKFIYPKNVKNMEDSNLWNLETYRKYCARNNINYDKLNNEIADIFIKMMLSVREKLIKEIEDNNLESSNFYHLIGFDIILDENLKPYLLEANRRCGFRADNDAEKYYTFNIIADTLNIIGIRNINLNIVNERKIKGDLLKENLEESLCELDRPRGGFDLIFPLKKNVEKYKPFFGDNIPEEDKELWKLLDE